jgi:phosphatidylserine/phosphatidylglycerophosphate/cardiolipin synthase-like enzyme
MVAVAPSQNSPQTQDKPIDINGLTPLTQNPPVLNAGPVDGIMAPPAAIPTKLSPPAKADPYGPAFWKDIARLSGRPEAQATSLVPLRDSQLALKARIDLINSAKSSVMFNLYHMLPDSSSFQVMEAMIKKARSGIPVMLKLDALAQMVAAKDSSKADSKKLDAFFKVFEAAGGTLTYWDLDNHPERDFGHGDHFKALVVDGGKVIFGGRNSGNTYFKTWTDFDIQCEGTLATQIAQEAVANMVKTAPIGSQKKLDKFNALFHKVVLDVEAAHEKAMKDAYTMKANGEQPVSKGYLLTYDPTYDKDHPNNITDALVEMFDKAETSIVLSSNYVNGTKRLQDAIIRAAKRGVKVTIITASLADSEVSTFPWYNAKRHYPDLLKAGVIIRETTSFEHGKMFLVDDRIGAWGSYNVEHPADDKLTEGLYITKDPYMVGLLRDNLNDTLEHRTKPYVEQKLGFWASIADFFLTLIAWIVEPLA